MGFYGKELMAIGTAPALCKDHSRQVINRVQTAVCGPCGEKELAQLPSRESWRGIRRVGVDKEGLLERWVPRDTHSRRRVE